MTQRCWRRRWMRRVRALPLPLAVDVARQAAASDLARALAVLRTVRPQIETQDLPVLVNGLAAVPLTGSAMMLQDILADSPPKALQKSVKKALHRLKSRGVVFGDSQGTRQVVLGNTAGQLERCLASFIDATGDRMILMNPYQARRRLPDRLPGSQLRYRHPFCESPPGKPLENCPSCWNRCRHRRPLIELEPAHCQRQIALIQQVEPRHAHTRSGGVFHPARHHRRVGRNAGNRLPFTRRLVRRNWKWPEPRAPMPATSCSCLNWPAGPFRSRRYANTRTHWRR